MREGHVGNHRPVSCCLVFLALANVYNSELFGKVTLQLCGWSDSERKFKDYPAPRGRNSRETVCIVKIAISVVPKKVNGKLLNGIFSRQSQTEDKNRVWLKYATKDMQVTK